MTGVLDTLERNGYIHRQADPADRRRVLVDLTPAAQAVLDRLLPEVQQMVTAVMGALDDQALHTLLHHLAVVRHAVATAPVDLPPPAPRRTPPTCAVPEPCAQARQPSAAPARAAPRLAEHPPCQPLVRRLPCWNR
jgi:MarR family